MERAEDRWPHPFAMAGICGPHRDGCAFSGLALKVRLLLAERAPDKASPAPVLARRHRELNPMAGFAACPHAARGPAERQLRHHCGAPRRRKWSSEDACSPRDSTTRWSRGQSHSTAVTLLLCVGEAPEGCHSRTSSVGPTGHDHGRHPLGNQPHTELMRSALRRSTHITATQRRCPYGRDRAPNEASAYSDRQPPPVPNDRSDAQDRADVGGPRRHAR
jgi:hypothetical protein